jgi:hypothetical protein
MTVIGTEVLAVDSLSALYRAIVRIGFPRYRGSFLTLKFGEKKPFTGFTQNGQLDLVYHEDPLLRAGQLFPVIARDIQLLAAGLPPNQSAGRSRLRFLRVQKWEERHAE